MDALLVRFFALAAIVAPTVAGAAPSSVRRSTVSFVLQAGQGNETSFIGSFVSSRDSGF